MHSTRECLNTFGRCANDGKEVSSKGKVIVKVGKLLYLITSLDQNIVQFLRLDGIHFTELGYNIFLNNLRGEGGNSTLKSVCDYPGNW